MARVSGRRRASQAPTRKEARPALTVDCVIFGVSPDGILRLLLVRRGKHPFRGRWALPGGFVNVSDDGSQGEGLEDAARRELREETGARIESLEQFATFGQPGRDPRGRVVSVAHMALVRTRDHAVAGGDDAAEAAWVPVHELDKAGRMAFDHAEIVRVGVARLQAEVRHAPVGIDLLPRTFTLTELRRLYESVLRRPLDKRTFRRRILATGILAGAGAVLHRAAALYRFDRRAYARAIRCGCRLAF